MTGYGDTRSYTAMYKEYYVDVHTDSARHTMIKGVKNTDGHRDARRCTVNSKEEGRVVYVVSKYTHTLLTLLTGQTSLMFSRRGCLVEMKNYHVLKPVRHANTALIIVETTVEPPEID
jgi:DNA-directed RNA polymerase subunit L